MTWPKKNTRRLNVGNDIYLWHINRWPTSAWFVVRREDCEHGQLLFGTAGGQLAQWGSGTVRDVVDFALLHGWTPKKQASPLYITTDNRRYFVDTRRVKSPVLHALPRTESGIYLLSNNG